QSASSEMRIEETGKRRSQCVTRNAGRCCHIGLNQYGAGCDHAVLERFITDGLARVYGIPAIGNAVTLLSQGTFRPSQAFLFCRSIGLRIRHSGHLVWPDVDAVALDSADVEHYENCLGRDLSRAITSVGSSFWKDLK